MLSSIWQKFDDELDNLPLEAVDIIYPQSKNLLTALWLN